MGTYAHDCKSAFPRVCRGECKEADTAIAAEYQTILDNSHHFTNVWFVNPDNMLLARVKENPEALNVLLSKRRDADPKRLLVFEAGFMPVDESVLIDGRGVHWVITDPSSTRRAPR